MSEIYFKWFSKSWYKAGGLIQPSKAGAMVGLSGARMTQIWKEQKLELYKYKNEKPFLGWKDFLDFKTKRESNQQT